MRKPLRRPAIALGLLAAVGGGACSGSPRTARPTASPTPTPTLSPTPTASPTPKPAVATGMAYTDRGDLSYLDVASGVVTRLTVDGDSRQERSPVFTDAQTVAFAVDRDIVEIDVKTKARRIIRSVGGVIHAIDWNADRTQLAVLFDRNDPGGVGLTLRVEAFGSGSTREVRRFKPWDGRGGSDDDEVAVRWSPDGAKLLAVLTPLDTVSNQTMFVLTQDGKDAVPPRFGTMARWAPGSQTVYYRDYAAPGAWHAIDTATGTLSDLAMRRSTARPAVSADGKLIVHDEGDGTPTVYVYDVSARTERVLTTGVLSAVWLSPEAIAATQVRQCIPGTDCEGAWVSEHRARRVALSTGAKTTLSATSTFDAAAFSA